MGRQSLHFFKYVFLSYIHCIIPYHNFAGLSRNMGTKRKLRISIKHFAVTNVYKIQIKNLKSYYQIQNSKELVDNSKVNVL